MMGSCFHIHKKTAAGKRLHSSCDIYNLHCCKDPDLNRARKNIMLTSAQLWAKPLEVLSNVDNLIGKKTRMYLD